MRRTRSRNRRRNRIHAILQAMGNKLENDCAAMMRADEAHNQELADDADQLVSLAGRVIENMLTKATPTPRYPGMSFDANYWTGRLSAAQGSLKEALIVVAREERENEATYIAKQKAIEAYDQTFSQVAAFVSAMLGVAGEKELARRVRPSVRRPGQTDEVAASEGAGNSAPGATSAAAPATATTSANAPATPTTACNG